MALFRDRRIVQIHEFRADAAPPVILMEHVEGFELGRMAPSLDFRQRARIMLEICEAVQHAHDLGIQHRDLKPSNILVDNQGEPQVADFGLAKMTEEVRRSTTVVGGTPYYMAPEMLKRRGDQRSDIYSLGVVLYELLCGQAPFTGDSPVAVAYQHVAEYAVPPSGINPDIPADLEAVVERAMEKDPDSRYQ